MIINFFQQFYDGLIATSLLEFVAVIFGILSVVFARKENILVYPTGIISVLIYVYLTYHGKLYADMGINVFYFFMSVYGWWAWTRKTTETSNQRPITITSTKENILYVILTAASYGILYYFLSNYTDSDVAHIDAFTTSVFFIGMYLMAIKKVENWIFWIIGDVISIPLYIYKGYAFSGFQFMVFLVIAVLGYIEWRKRYKESLND